MQNVNDEKTKIIFSEEIILLLFMCHVILGRLQGIYGFLKTVDIVLSYNGSVAGGYVPSVGACRVSSLVGAGNVAL